MKRLFLLLIFVLLNINLANAQIAIRSFESTPDTVLPGKEIQLRIKLANIGDDNIKNISLKLILDNLPFAPLHSSTEKTIDELDENEESTIIFDLVTLSNAESQVYKIPVKLSYNNANKDSLISIEVNAEPKLDLILEDTDLVKVNDNGKVTVKLVNNGLSQIKFLTLTLNENSAYEILSANKVYIGDVDVGDFESEEFTIIPRIENPELTFNVYYRDLKNNEFFQSKNIKLNIYSEEKARELGLIKKSFLSSIIIPIVIILIIYLIYRRFRKRKNAV